MSIRQALAAAIVEFGRCVDQLATYTPDDWEDAGDEAEGLYKELERQRNRLALIDTAFLKGTATRRPRAEHKQVQWLVREFPMNAQVARVRVRAAERINDAPDSATITSTKPEGTVSPQFMSAMREAVADGLLCWIALVLQKCTLQSTLYQHNTTMKSPPWLMRPSQTWCDNRARPPLMGLEFTSPGYLTSKGHSRMRTAIGNAAFDWETRI